jgi:hypothetical protein
VLDTLHVDLQSSASILLIGVTTLCVLFLKKGPEGPSKDSACTSSLHLFPALPRLETLIVETGGFNLLTVSFPSLLRIEINHLAFGG